MTSLAEPITVKVEVEETRVLLVLPKKCSSLVVPWQEGWMLGKMLEKAASDIIGVFRPFDPYMGPREMGQVRLNTYRDQYLALLFDHTDRIVFGQDAAFILAFAIQIKCHDLELLSEGVRVLYQNGNAVPQWEHKRKSFPIK